jgi:hypothetical protein
MIEPASEGAKRTAAVPDIDTTATPQESALPTPFAVPVIVHATRPARQQPVSG